MQIVYISNRPRILDSTFEYLTEFMRFVDDFLVFCPHEQIAGFRKIDARLSVFDERELLQDENPADAQDHQRRNFMLRSGLAGHQAVASSFLLSDDDYRPLMPVAESYFLSGGKYQAYYFYTLAAWQEMLGHMRRLTSYDRGSRNSYDILSRRNFSTLMFSAHMPQIVDRAMLEKAMEEFAAPRKQYDSLGEWEIYFNYAMDRFPNSFHAPRPFDVIGWPDKPHWPWHVAPTHYVFENYYESAYREGGLFCGLPESYDPITHAEVTAEKIRRYEKVFKEHRDRERVKAERKKSAPGRHAARVAKRRFRDVLWGAEKAAITMLSKTEANGPRKIHVAGLLRSATGLGGAAAMLQATLAESGSSVDAEAIDISASFLPSAPIRDKREARSLAVGRGSIVACVNPPQTSAYFRRLSARRLIGKRRIGYWWWEFPGFPEQWKEFVSDVDEVWVSSRFIYENWRSILDVPIRWVPLDLRAGNGEPASLGRRLDRSISLLTVVNLGSTLSRKNPAAAIDVFERVRAAANRPVTLTIKIGKLGQYPDRYREFLKLNTTQPGINVVVSELNDRDFDRLIDDHDIYLSMHRAEGLGLPMAKAMFRGKVVQPAGPEIWIT